MPILVAILFGIGVLAIADTSKLPWFLQIIRAGLVIALRWGFKIGAVVLVICLWVWGYDTYTARKKAEIERKQWIADSTATTVQPIPEYGTPEYRNWRIYNFEKAEELEAKMAAEADQSIVDQSITKETETSKNEDTLLPTNDNKKAYTFLTGSWSRSDKTLSSTESKGTYTFKKDGSFFTSNGYKGNFKLNRNTETLFLYFDNGDSESFKIKDFNEDELSSQHEQQELTEVFFLKRPVMEEEKASKVIEVVQQ